MGKHHQAEAAIAYPAPAGLYHPAAEKDSCGVGFVADIKGRPSHQIMQDAFTMNARMAHRGGCGFEANTGDGAGILVALPHSFFAAVAKETLPVALAPPGRYAVGNVFLPRDAGERARCVAVINGIIAAEGQQLAGWRELPVAADGAGIGPAARAAAPHMSQLFINAAPDIDAAAFDRALYLIRKRFSRQLRHDPSLREAKRLYCCSLSGKVIVYKGMLTPNQLFPFYPDLGDPRFETHLAMVHSRFSTNTFPSWDRAQPNRWMSHNGEINTVRGNVNAMVSREGTVASPAFGERLPDVFPVIEDEQTDSGAFDSVLELLLLAGRSLPEAIMMMIPEAWQSHPGMKPAKRAFYEFHSALMEPWDGPASIVFTDGHYIGAVLDRNGLRPSRYYITADDRCVMASEVGVLPVEPAQVKVKGRLRPGRMFLLDFEEGRLIPDAEVKSTIADRRPYGDWLRRQKLALADIAGDDSSELLAGDGTVRRMRAFGYTTETMQFMLLPLITEARDPLGSMGNDAALACLSDQPRMIYDYFKQLFAQVTNPAIDSTREEIVMSLRCFIGPEGNLLDSREEQGRRLSLDHPLLSNRELAHLKAMDHRGMKTRLIDITYDRAEVGGLRRALDRVCAAASQAIADGMAFIVLSDRAIGADRIPLSALIACGAVHQHLVARHSRTQIGIVVETGEAREVHHHCLLIGFGADAVNPYLALEALWQAKEDGSLAGIKDERALVAAYKKGVGKGMLKVMAKMGISTLQSYKGAQIFEAVGLADEVMTRCFTGTASRVQGVDFQVLEEEARRRHALGFPQRDTGPMAALPNPGDFHWRSGGDAHAWNPDTLFNLQLAARGNSRAAYDTFARRVNEDANRRCVLRGLLRFRTAAGAAVPINEVEPAGAIVKRFATGAMSFGSISEEAHESLAIAMNRLGGKSNTGEGGEDPARYRTLPNGDSKRSAIKQVASGRFGVTISYLTNADELQIKIAQGAKPGEGGELPGGKVDGQIARIRHSTPGVGLISPPPHHDIYSIEDIAQLIHDLKNANPAARVSVKLVSEAGVGTIAAGVTKAKADHLVIAGHDGGTGASPLTSIKHAGLPWELGLAETHQTLVMNNLRSRVVLQTDGQLKTGRDVAVAALLGAEEFGFATAPLITLGCIMMRKCHLNTCPVGIATQDPALRKKFRGQPEHVVNYLFMVAEELRVIMAELGFRTVNEMVGRVDMLEAAPATDHWKAKGLDLSLILQPARAVFPDTGRYQTIQQDHGLERALDHRLIAAARDALESGRKVVIEEAVSNTDRVVGTMLSNAVAKRWGEELLPDDTITIKLTGTAGQSLGAWLAKGITLTVEGDANDYVGKGLSGGKIILRPHGDSTFRAEDNVIAGNVILYGATSGEVYLRGIVAERFAVRNSGAHAVVEGVGDHGCEYMTGGRVVILGATGRNFGAGMSGGIAYVWDRAGTFPQRCNRATFELEAVREAADILELERLILNHRDYTGSPVAAAILDRWETALREFVKVMPTDYKRVLAARPAAVAA